MKTLIDLDNVALIVKETLEEMMTGFDSIEDRDDFIMDIVSGVKKRIKNEKDRHIQGKYIKVWDLVFSIKTKRIVL